MMIASIFIEAWDLYTISFLLIFLSAQYHPSALLLGLGSAGTQAGAIVGALVGGWLMDRLGRRVMFLGTRLSLYGFLIVLVSLIVAGLAISSNILWLVPVAAASML
jgi:MFS family permease